MRKRAAWELDARFCALAKVAWPLDWAYATRPDRPHRAQARNSMARRFEGFHVTRALAEQQRRLGSDCSRLERRLAEAREAIAALIDGMVPQ